MRQCTFAIIVLTALGMAAQSVPAQSARSSTRPVDPVAAAKEQKDAQRRSLDEMPNGGMLQSVSQLLTIELVDDKLRPTWTEPDLQPPVANAPNVRFDVAGSKAAWVLRRTQNSGRGSGRGSSLGTVNVLSRVEPDRLDADGPWSMNLMHFIKVDQGPVLAINATFGPSADRDVVYLESDLVTGATILTVRSRQRTLVNLNEPSFTLLAQRHPDAVRKYLVPLLRDVNGPEIAVP